MDIIEFKKRRIVKKNKSKNTTITIKVDSELRSKWNIFCEENNINQRATLTNFLIDLMEG